MKKLLALSVVLAVFVLSQTSYGGGSAFVVVYKGTIKASKTVVDINDTNSLSSCVVHGYWAIAINTSTGDVYDSNAVIYDAKQKYYKKTQDASLFTPPVDPCNVRILAFGLGSDDGILEIVAVGKCKLTRIYDDPNRALRQYVPSGFNGGGFLGSYAIFDHAYSGGLTISMVLDPKLTIQANSVPYYNVHEMIDEVIVPRLTVKDPNGWTSWPGSPLGNQ
jgi:hypothetical protein